MTEREGPLSTWADGRRNCESRQQSPSESYCGTTQICTNPHAPPPFLRPTNIASSPRDHLWKMPYRISIKRDVKGRIACQLQQHTHGEQGFCQSPAPSPLRTTKAVKCTGSAEGDSSSGCTNALHPLPGAPKVTHLPTKYTRGVVAPPVRVQGAEICARTSIKMCAQIYGIMQDDAGLCAKMYTVNKDK